MNLPQRDFYVLKLSYDPDVIGPDLSQLVLKGPRPKPDRSLLDPFPSYKEPLTFELQHRGKWTDLLHQPSMVGPYLTMTKEFKEELEKFNLGPHHFYRSIFSEERSKVTKAGYWLALDFMVGQKQIDFNKSTFHKINYLNRQSIEDVSIGSFEEYRSIRQTYRSPYSIRGKEVAFLKDCHLDIFFVTATQKIHISSRLASHLQKTKLTGFEILEM